MKRPALLTLATLFLLSTFPAYAADPTPIPGLEKWQTQAVTKGKRACAAVMQANAEGALASAYYDALRIYRWLLETTGDRVTWQPCVDAARRVYRGYVEKSLKDKDPRRGYGYIPGYMNFTAGLRADAVQGQEPKSREAVGQIAKNAAFSSGVTSLGSTVSADLSREVAYAILAMLNAEALGEPPVTQLAGDVSVIGKPRRPLLVHQAYDHLEQWFVRQCWKAGNTCPRKLAQFSPFMVGLTAYALIKDWEQTKDPRALPALRLAADWLWDNGWDATKRGMFYDAMNGGMGPGKGAPDLNLLIAPMYAWLYSQTGEPKYRDQGDALFSGGVDLAWLDGAKQYHQSYMLSPEYVTWRQGQPPVPPAAITLSGIGISMAGSAQGAVACQESGAPVVVTVPAPGIWTVRETPLNPAGGTVAVVCSATDASGQAVEVTLSVTTAVK